MDEITTSKTGWLFNPKLICIHHRNSECKVCSDYMMHVLMTFAEADATWESAEAERTKFLTEKFGSNGSGDELRKLKIEYEKLRSKLDQLRSENAQLNKDCDRYRSRAYDAEEHVAGLEKSIRTRDTHIHDLKKKLDDWKNGDNDSNLSTKKRKMSSNLTSLHTHAYSPSVSMDRSESPIGFVISPAEAAPFMDSSALPYNNSTIPLPKRRRPPTEPVTTAQVEEYVRLLRESEQQHSKPAWPIFNMLEQLML
ncbi:hypothetical protein C8R42DRAFT_643331 [Lentinula raphanica]|nr:hypothetical protein C8R42DRAFT_643331 [Lentinula raphanica]